MSFRPNNFGDYHLSDVFAGGTDFSEENGNIVYIACVNLDRGIAIKAFLNSYKLNVTKVVEFEEDEGMIAKIPKEYGTDLNYQISLDVPSYDVLEAKNNLAKIEELQKLLAKIGSKVSNIFPDVRVPFFSVWFKNLISSGKNYVTYPTPQSVTINQIINCGFICIIEKVKYEPDMDAGFFESDGLLLPKNIKLNLELKYGVEFDTNDFKNLRDEINTRQLSPSYTPLFSFKTNGHYNSKDKGVFPYGIKIHDYPDYIENIGSTYDFSNETLNKIDTSTEGGYDPTRIFISIEVPTSRGQKSTEDTSRRRRWVAFKPFIESFSRDVEMGYTKNENKARSIGVATANMADSSKLNNLVYEITFNVPSHNLEEAKRNCGKIQYLIRMLAKASDVDQVAKSEEEAKAKDELTKRTVKVYIPNFIENKSAGDKVDSFTDMYNNSLSLVFTNLSFDIDPNDGFFEENVLKDGKFLPKKIYPKSMKISLSFKHANPEKVIKSYNLRGSGNNTYYTQRGGVSSAKFPFRKQTIKLGR
jgi:hypothetical protein